MASLNRHRSVFAAALIAASVAGVAQAQYRVDNSQSNDASNRIGSGGFNGGGPANPYAARGFNAGNLVVTGNVTGGRAFRGSLGYTAANQFRGNTGSGDFDRFIGDSVGIGQVREAPSGVFANQATNVRPYFGAGQTVQRPAGFVSDPAYGGGFVPQRPRTVQSNDGRIDYGGASHSQYVNGILAESTVIGGAGLSTTSTGSILERDRLDVSEYTSLTRLRVGNAPGEGPGDVVRAARDASLAPAEPNAKAPGEATPNANNAGATNANTPDNQPQNVGRPQNAGQPGGEGTIAPQPGDPAAAARTGQSLSLRTQMNSTDGSQYGQLRERFAEQQRSRLPNADAIEQSRRYNEQVLKNRAAAEAKAAGENKPGDAKPGEQPKPGEAKPGGTTPGGARPPVDDDGLRMPRPTGVPQAAPKPAAPQAPLEIKSLTTGVQDANLKKTLGEAEQLMKAGKFTSAIDAYDRAEAMTAADPLVFVGRGIAELGGGYYRNAERHFRQAFDGDRSLLLARFDLNELLSKDRLNFLLDDLGRVANANKNDPGPLVLLAFVYYNVNLPDRASRALDLADQRAGGKDELAHLFRENWALKPAAGGESK